MCANIIRMCFIWVRFIPVEVIPEIGVCEGSPLAHPYFSGFLSSLAKALRIWEFPGRLPDLGVRDVLSAHLTPKSEYSYRETLENCIFLDAKP